MAEVPNAFADLLRGQTPDAMYDTLRRERCLSPAGLEERQRVVVLIEKSAEEWRHDQELGIVGPTMAYQIAGTLMHDGCLNARATELLKTITYQPHPRRWWRFW